MIIEQTGGRIQPGRKNVLEVEPRALHRSTPLFIGSPDDVAEAEELAHPAEAPLATERPGCGRRSGLEPLGLVGEVHEWLASAEASYVLQQDLQMALGNPGGAARDMWRDDHVFHLPQRVVGR